MSPSTCLTRKLQQRNSVSTLLTPVVNCQISAVQWPPPATLIDLPTRRAPPMKKVVHLSGMMTSRLQSRISCQKPPVIIPPAGPAGLRPLPSISLHLLQTAAWIRAGPAPPATLASPSLPPASPASPSHTSQIQTWSKGEAAKTERRINQRCWLRLLLRQHFGIYWRIWRRLLLASQSDAA